MHDNKAHRGVCIRWGATTLLATSIGGGGRRGAVCDLLQSQAFLGQGRYDLSMCDGMCVRWGDDPPEYGYTCILSHPIGS